MRHSDDQDLVRIAGAVSDGVEVNWQAESGARPVLRPKLEGLRLIQAVADAHRPKTAVGLADAPTGAAPPPSPTTAAPVHWGALEIRGILGRGGFGEVYRAYDPELRREVALKLWRASTGTHDPASKSIVREGQRLARVRHDNVLRIHGAARHDGRIGLWTDLVRGKTLEQVLADHGPLDAGHAALIGMDLCRALAAVHAAGLVHRDVKTANIMQEQGGRIVLMDFGSVTERPGASATGGADPLSGTPLFMAPEAVLDNASTTPAADIYSLGVVLFRLVTGRFPVEGKSWADLVERHRRRSAMPLCDARADLPVSFAQVVERALDSDPRRRFQTAGSMGNALAATIGARRENSEAPVPSWKGRRAAYATAAVVVTLLGAGVLWQRLNPGPLRVEANLYRERDGVEERLRTGSRIRPGDELFMEIRGREKMHVYVLNEDRAGNAFVLFPAGLDLANPLPRGRHRLPGRMDGAQQNWQVTSAGGRDTFLVVASREPLPDLERDVASMPRAVSGRQIAYAPVAPQTMETLRGIGGLASSTTTDDSSAPGRAGDIFQDLTSRAQEQSGLWTLRIDLQNPGQ